MTNGVFPLFHSAFPPTRERDAYDPARHDTLAARVPALVAAEWRSSGFGAYGSGLLWTVVPDAPYLSPENWPALDGTGIEVLRTAFADVCLWQNGRFLWQSVYTGKATPMSSDAEIL